MGRIVGIQAPVAGSSEYLAYTTTAAYISETLNPQAFYQLSLDAPCYIRQSDDGTHASAADGSILVPGGAVIDICGEQGAYLSIKAQADPGEATVFRVRTVR